MKKILFFIVLFTGAFVFGQERGNIEVDLSTPQSTIRTHLHFLSRSDYHPEKSAQTIQGYQGKHAEKLAIKIKKILRGRGLYVVFNEVPNNPNFIDTIQNKPIYRYVLFPNRMPEIYVEKVGDKWYYSKHTLLQVDELYNETFPWYARKMQQILPKFENRSFLGIALWKYMGLLIVLLLGVLVFFIFYRLVYYMLIKVQKTISKITHKDTTSILKKIARPISLIIVMGLIRAIVPALQMSVKFNQFLFFAVDLMMILFVVYVFLKLVDLLMALYTYHSKKTETKLDDQLAPILQGFLNIIIVILGIFKILSFLGINPITIIAGASIGGLAVALASQDTVKNFIGTIMIFVDKPFQIGDWISAGDLEGTVEKVGFRSTIVRAPDTSIYQITNSRLSEITVNNRGLLRYRRYKTHLGVRYDTPPELVEAFVKGVRQIIEKHPGTLSDTYNVEFTGFGDSALLILLNVYFVDTNWNREQAAKHSLHMAILKFANEIGVGFAFPSTTVMVEQFPNTENDFPKYKATQEDVDNALKGITFDN